MLATNVAAFTAAFNRHSVLSLRFTVAVLTIVFLFIFFTAVCHRVTTFFWSYNKEKFQVKSF
jgi:hypothetical protein